MNSTHIQKTITAFILFFTIISAVIATLAETTTTYYCVSENGLRVRFSPGGEVIGYLEYGEEVEVISINGEWAEINFSDIRYCSVKYLSLTPPSTEKQTGTIVANGRVAVRKAPDGKRIGWVHNGDKIEILAELNGWYSTNKGYISSDYISIER